MCAPRSSFTIFCRSCSRNISAGASRNAHRARLRNFARFGTAAIVTTRTVAADFEAHMETLGRKDVPIFIAATPVSATFLAPRVVVPTLGGLPYFVFCSTIEPRKNHLMLLAVWRALVARLGKAAPKLVLVGTRAGIMTRSLISSSAVPPLRDTVIEVGGLSTPGLKRLIDNARALLMPTFGKATACRFSKRSRPARR